MGDMQDPKYGSKYDNTPVMNKIYDTVGRPGSNRGSLHHLGGGTAEENVKNGVKRETLRRRIASMTLKKKSKITKVVFISELLIDSLLVFLNVLCFSGPSLLLRSPFAFCL